jgi:hypothetical protein
MFWFFNITFARVSGADFKSAISFRHKTKFLIALYNNKFVDCIKFSFKLNILFKSEDSYFLTYSDTVLRRT